MERSDIVSHVPSDRRHQEELIRRCGAVGENEEERRFLIKQLARGGPVVDNAALAEALRTAPSRARESTCSTWSRPFLGIIHCSTAPHTIHNDAHVALPRTRANYGNPGG